MPERHVPLLYGSGRRRPDWLAEKTSGRGVCPFRPVYDYRRSSMLNEFLAEQDKGILAGALANNTTIAKAVDDYAKTHLSMPGGVSHKIIATRLALLGEHLPLNAIGRRFLSDLRPKLEDAFKHAYVLTQENG